MCYISFQLLICYQKFFKNVTSHKTISIIISSFSFSSLSSWSLMILSVSESWKLKKWSFRIKMAGSFHNFNYSISQSVDDKLHVEDSWQFESFPLAYWASAFTTYLFLKCMGSEMLFYAFLQTYSMCRAQWQMVGLVNMCQVEIGRVLKLSVPEGLCGSGLFWSLLQFTVHNLKTPSYEK